MKLFFCITLYVSSFIYLTSCTLSGVRAPNSTKVKPKHHVITLHGVRGDANAYGAFHNIAKGNLEELNSGYEIITHNWTYPVGGKVVETQERNGRDFIWTPHHIAEEFNRNFFLAVDAKIKDLGSEDKISLVAYSMGGLMAMTWYYDTMFNFAGAIYKKGVAPVEPYSASQHQLLLARLEKVENIIGLGAVFWGSVDSELGWSFLENGNLAEAKKSLPKLKNFCRSEDIQKIIKDQSFYSKTISKVARLWNKEPDLTAQQKNDQFVKNTVWAACKTAKLLPTNLEPLSPIVLKGIHKLLVSQGNINPLELDNMRLTSDIINKMKMDRIKHVSDNNLKNRFQTKWTSIVGVFPCLGKKDQGLTCSDFISQDYRLLNNGMVDLFSGHKRRETDGPVLSSSAVADFLYYTEEKGLEHTNISADQFANTNTQNQEIFVENMHATVTPALESLPGLLNPMGMRTAKAVEGFDQKLGLDVVSIDANCKLPETCEHPNYKHILQTLADCSAADNSYSKDECNQHLMNRYYHNVTESTERLLENNKLKNEMGSFVLTFNINLPRSTGVDKNQIDQELKKNILKIFKFNFVRKLNGARSENRMDTDAEPYALQIAREAEIMSSYSRFETVTQGHTLRVFFIGRVWLKDEQNITAKSDLEKGVPVNFSINIPGVRTRNVTALIKPTYTTHINMYMK